MGLMKRNRKHGMYVFGQRKNKSSEIKKIISDILLMTLPML